MNILTCFPSKYLKHADLHDKHIRVIMSHVAMEEIATKDGTELRPVLYFEKIPKGMVLNITNSKAIIAGYDKDTEAWAGMPIILFPAMVPFGAETVEAIRIKLPSAAERIRHIKDSAHKDALGDHMIEQAHERPINMAWVPPATSDADMARARDVFVTRKPTPRPQVHDGDGVVWEETAERPLTPTERTEQLTAQLKESLARANAALDERREARGATKPDDDLDIPAAFDRRPKPPEPDHTPTTWIELMQAAE